MKNVLPLSLIMALLFSACSDSSKSNEVKNEERITNSGDTASTYACSMHPEIIGKKGDKCSECSMELTEVMKNTMDSTKMK